MTPPTARCWAHSWPSSTNRRPTSRVPSCSPARPTTALVTDGPYQYTRNPIYVSFASIGLGIGLILNSYWVLGSVTIAVLGLHFLVVLREERYLETVIDHAYAGYRENVRRWL